MRGTSTGRTLVHLLADRLAEQGSEPGAGVTVAALCKDLLPYGACREILGIASKGEYDVALLRFMRDSGVLALDAELTKAIDKELSNPEPGLAFLKNFAAAKVAVHVRRVSAEGVDEPEEVPDEAAEETAMSVTEGEEAARCSRCDEELPTDREVLFCPFCGHDQSQLLCGQCGDDLGEGWRFCPRCGTAVER